MQKSTNYEMNLPEGYDQFDIGHFNQNTRFLDTKIKSLEDVTSNVNYFSKKLTSTLSAGGVQVVFTDPDIKATSYIDVYTSVYGINPSGVEVSGNTCTVSFPVQNTNIDVAIVVNNWRE